jgi:hypothetical protein
MSTDKKNWISDKAFFWLVTGVSVAVLAVVVLLRYLPSTAPILIWPDICHS